MDISYVTVGNGWMHQAAIMELYSHFFVRGSMSNTITLQWCKESLETAIIQHGKPEILFTDQGSQFTSPLSTEFVTKGQNIQFSMDGKGRAIDNIFVERFCRNIKYIEPLEDGIELYGKIKWYMEFYNNRRGHQTLNYKRPEKLFRTAA